MYRYDLLKALATIVTEQDLFVCSVGGLGDDWWNHRPGQVDNTFSPEILGSISTTALGLAVALPHRRIIALETDASVLMNVGAMCTLGHERPPNLTVIVLDNGMCECIGGAPTLTSFNADLAKMAGDAGYPVSLTVRDLETFRHEAMRLLNDDQLGYLVAKLEPGTHPWPQEQREPWDGIEEKYRFIRFVEKLEGISIHRGAPPRSLDDALMTGSSSRSRRV